MAGVDGYGVKLERSDMADPSPVFTAIANVTNVGGPEIERETRDVSAHDTPDGWKEFIGAGLKDGGELSLEVNYDPRVHDTLVADFDDDLPRDYRLSWPPDSSGDPIGVWELSLILTGFSPEGPVDDKLAAELTFKVNGKPVIS
ncbi:phage tail tube protein [Pseudonocardia sp. RS010]|uniref:phage tail tube protein n=1 Tax=Pseudonocardia sp. RS010 TaxID=3385979 RepID=UPI0039A0DE5E